MATTAGGTPYVESSDLVANYPAVSLALAEHIDGLGSGVLQVVSATTATYTVSTSTSYVDTTLTATITPTSATSTIFVIAVQNSTMVRNSNALYLSLKLLRDATTLVTQTETQGLSAVGATVVALASSNSINWLDSPATTSAITYKIQGALSTAANGATVYFQNSSTSFMTLIEVAA